MTMLDDDLLTQLFGQAGASFAVPETGAADIAAASGGPVPNEADPEPEGVTDPAPSRPRRLARTMRGHRVLTAVAACLVVLLVFVGGAAWIGRSPTPRSVALRGPSHKGASTVLRPAHSTPSTTLPSSASGTAAPGLATNSGNQAANSFAATEPNRPASTTSGSTALPTGAVGQSSEIEQTGNLSLSVGRNALSKTMTQLTFLASLYNGFVANSQTQLGSSAGGVPSGTITLQIPVNNFDPVLKKAQAMGRTTDLSTKATDVTGQYIDLQARITALQDSEQQYLTIMTKATSIGDILSVQAQIDQLQTQIEQLQGQLQVLTSETAYSTLTITISEGAPPVHHTVPHHRSSGIAKAWHDSVHGFTDGVDGLVGVAGPVLFGLLCAGALLLGARLGWRRYQRHNL